MELYVIGICNSYHAELSIRDHKPDGEPISETLWKCAHEHVEYREATACGEAEVRRWVTANGS